MPGPQPTPTRILSLRGSKRASSRKDKEYTTPKPKRPAWLKGASLRKWNELSDQLHAIKVLTVIDADALARYCDLWGNWLQARAKVTELAADGEADYFRWLRAYRALGEQLDRLGREFGLTPASRTGLDIQPAATDPLSQFKAGSA